MSSRRSESSAALAAQADACAAHAGLALNLRGDSESSVRIRGQPRPGQLHAPYDPTVSSRLQDVVTGAVRSSRICEIVERNPREVLGAAARALGAERSDGVPAQAAGACAADAARALSL